MQFIFAINFKLFKFLSMNNKIFSFIFLIFAFLTLSACSIKNINTENKINSSESIQKTNVEKNICYDCGKGGWEKMDKKCNKNITNKKDFKNCLMTINWSNKKDDTGVMEMRNVSVEEMENGYIEINSMEILNKPSTNSIEVIIYRQWAVDVNGNLYLLGQLG